MCVLFAGRKTKQNTGELCMSGDNEMVFKKLVDFILHKAGNKLSELH